MKAKEAMIAWTPAFFEKYPTVGQVKVGPLLKKGDVDWTKGYPFSGGAAEVTTRELTGDAALRQLFIEFNTLVVRDGIDPLVAHKAFLAIDEYAQHISPDIPGARDGENSPLNKPPD